MAKRNSNTIQDIYKHYTDNTEDNYSIDYKTYRDVLNSFFQMLSYNLIEEGHTIKLPYNLGYLDIVKSRNWIKAKRYSIDFKATREYGKIIYHLNEHSGGYKHRCHWTKFGCNIANLNKYRFIMTRTNKRRLAQIILNRERDYVEI